MEQDTAGTDGSVGSLASIVDANGPLAFADVLSMGADVAQALADRHAGGEPHGAVQAHAVVRGGDGPWLLAAPGLAEGPTVAAPELAEGDPATPAADVYALGATLVFALTGQAFETGALGAEEPVPALPDAEGDPAAGADEPSDAGAVAEVPISARSLPDVMAAFLDTLRRTLATDPATRGTAAALAGTLRQLRNEADRALAPPVPIVDDRPTQAASAVELGVGAAAGVGAMAFAADAAGAEGLDQAGAFGPEAGTAGTAAGAGGVDGVDGELPVDGTQPGDVAPSGARQRAPMLIAAAAVIVALILGIALVRKGDKSAELTSSALSTTTTMAPTTTAVPVTIIVPGTEVTTTVAPTTTTTKPATTTTAPPVTEAPTTAAPPPTTVPAGTVGVTVDMSHNSSCNRCPAPLRQLPSKAGSILAQVPDKIVLFGQCWTAGDDMHDDEGNSSNQWIYVTGPVGQGWIPVLFVGRAVPPGVEPCPQSTTTTTAPPTTTTTTTVAPTTTTSSSPPKQSNP